MTGLSKGRIVQPPKQTDQLSAKPSNLVGFVIPKEITCLLLRKCPPDITVEQLEQILQKWSSSIRKIDLKPGKLKKYPKLSKYSYALLELTPGVDYLSLLEDMPTFNLQDSLGSSYLTELIPCPVVLSTQFSKFHAGKHNVNEGTIFEDEDFIQITQNNSELNKELEYTTSPRPDMDSELTPILQYLKDKAIAKQSKLEAKSATNIDITKKKSSRVKPPKDKKQKTKDVMQPVYSKEQIQILKKEHPIKPAPVVESISNGNIPPKLPPKKKVKGLSKNGNTPAGKNHSPPVKTSPVENGVLPQNDVPESIVQRAQRLASEAKSRPKNKKPVK